MHLLTRTLLSACTLALASTAMAMDGDMQTRQQAYGDAVSAANSSYSASMSDCRSMAGDERRNCRADAKIARAQALHDARVQRRSITASSTPGNTPADRKDRDASNPQTRTIDATP
jgi:hypothetical protein